MMLSSLMVLPPAMMLSLMLPLMPQRCPVRTRCPRAALPVDPLRGIDLQRRLGELTFAEVTSQKRDAEAVLRGEVASTSSSPDAVTVGLFYGQVSMTGSNRRPGVLIRVSATQQ